MIVEDQALLAMELEMVLADLGHIVVGCAMDRAGALVIAAQESPVLALVDINLLDGVSGPGTAADLIRDHGAAVIFLTANLEQIPEGFAGALGAISKPFDEATITAAVAFAGDYIRSGTVGDIPRRFQVAPWLTARPEDVPVS